MSRDDFDLDDFDEFEEPGFPEEDEAFLPPEETPSERPRRNTTFLIVATILVLVFILALGGATLYIIGSNERERERLLTIEAIYKTNTAVAIAINATETAKAWTATPSNTPTPTETPTPTPSDTPSPTPSPSETPTLDAGVLSLTPGTPATIPPLSDADLTGTQAAMDQTNAEATRLAESGATIDPTLAAQMTQDALNLTQTQIALELTLTAAAGSTVGDLTPGPTAISSPTELADTGLFEDLAGGAGAPNSLAVVGFAALGLVSLIVVARRLRIKTN
jgi:hypothetical protein